MQVSAIAATLSRITAEKDYNQARYCQLTSEALCFMPFFEYQLHTEPSLHL